ncbi:MAG TPA: methylamine utilization protein [Alphaproteobacteria bacterium]|nr:methylamine utilization protein [Alphaproteobacteria bacterium]
MNRILVPSLRAAAAVAAVLLAAPFVAGEAAPAWSEDQKQLIISLSLSALPKLPPDPSNRVADDPAAAALGEALFSDARFSGNGKVACASCHVAASQFQDNRPRGLGMGETARRTMPLAGTAYSPWLFWDGRKDSQWSQALGPLESPVEHGGDRTQYAHLIAANYAVPYEALFGPLPDLANLPPHAAPEGTPEAVAAWGAMSEAERDAVNRIFSNIGKAIAAFERTIMPPGTRFDRYAAALAQGAEPAGDARLTEQELAGLRLFIDKAECTRCHNGPLLTDMHFHNTGIPMAGSEPDLGRALGAKQVQADPFNCLGPYSDADPKACLELKYMVAEGEELVGAFKPPSLRGVAQRAPYMNAGQVSSLAEVLDHYNRAPAAPVGHSELDPLHLSPDELAALEAFLRTLDG